MKYIQSTFLLICLLLHTLLIKAQQNHFIYIQTENKQPFYLKMDKKIYSSTGSGYLIISKLKPDNYEFSIGFPKNEWPEQNLQCAILDKDLGFTLKNYSNEGWGLINLQTLAITKSGNPKKNVAATAVSTNDSFSNLLSSVVNDPTIKEEPTSVPTVVVPVKVIEIPKPVMPTSETVIIKKQTVKSSNGLEMVYIESVNGVHDTVNVLIPTATMELVADKEVKPVAEIVKVKEAEPLPQTTISSEKDTKFLNIELPNPHANATVAGPDRSTSSPMVNSDCKSFASEEDFMKLRKKMASANNPEMMITTAKKIFKTKCFNTDQVKNLSVLFLKDEGKYAFFDSVYPFVSDAQNFPSLQVQLTDGYYINRFKVMIRH